MASATMMSAVDGHAAREKPPRHAHPVGDIGEFVTIVQAPPECCVCADSGEGFWHHGRLDSNLAVVIQFPQIDNDDLRRGTEALRHHRAAETAEQERAMPVLDSGVAVVIPEGASEAAGSHRRCRFR